MIRRLNRHMLPITNYLFGSTLFRHELSHPQNQNLPRLAADAAAVMSKQLPVGWEERRNNLSEHDMMLVRVPPFHTSLPRRAGTRRLHADKSERTSIDVADDE